MIWVVHRLVHLPGAENNPRRLFLGVLRYADPVVAKQQAHIRWPGMMLSVAELTQAERI